MNQTNKFQNNFLNYESPEKPITDSKSIIIKKSKLSSLFRIIIFLGALMGTQGCASTSQNNKASANIIKDLIAELGARNSGLQIREDGTITGIINCEDDLDPSQALSKAEELNRSILEQTPDKTTSATKKLGDRTFTCVRGEINPEPKTIDDGIKKLLEGTGYNQVGIFNDTVIQYGEGDSEESAIADAKKNIEFFLPAGTYTRTNTKTLQLKRGENKGRWVALMHAIKKHDKKPTKVDSSKATVSIDQSKIKASNGVEVLESSEKLKINTKKRHYKIDKSRNSGENDLFGLCKTADKEEAWIFVKRKNGKETWNENGSNEQRGRASVDIKPMIEIVKGTSKITEISFYHHHPIETKAYNDTSQTPSSIDIINFIDTMEIIEKVNPELLDKLDFRIATSTGIYIIKLNPRILKNKRYMKRIINIANKLMWERLTFPHFDYSRRNLDNYHTQNIKFAKRFISKLMNIRFIPNKEALKKKSPGIKTVDLQKQVRDIDTQTLFKVFYAPQLQKIILKGNVSSTLYDGDGKRVGYIDEQMKWHIKIPKNGWPKNESESLNLNDYAQKIIKRLREEYKKSK